MFKITTYKFTYIVLLLVVSNIFWLGGVLIDFNYSPYRQIRSLGKQIKSIGEEAVEAIVFKWNGDRAYIDKVLASQLASSSGIRKGKSLETAILPLKRTYLSLSDYGFAKSKGAIEIVENKVLIVDRLGKLFEFSENKLTEIPIEIPTNLKESILAKRGKEDKTGGYDGKTELVAILDFVYDSANSRLVFSYVKYDRILEKDFVSVSSVRITFKDATLEVDNDWHTIIDTLTLGGGGGQVSILDGNLYFANGFLFDEGEDRFNALEEKSVYGKVFKVDLRNNKLELFSKGHRNISDFFIDKNQKLIASEHGPQGGDEINFIEKESNYGWPIRTYGTRYGSYDHAYELESANLIENYKEPLFSFVPSVGLSSIIKIDNFHASWDGNLLAGSLKGQTLYRLKLEKEKIILCEPIWMGHRIRDIVQEEDKIIILTDDTNLITLTLNEKMLSEYN